MYMQYIHILIYACNISIYLNIYIDMPVSFDRDTTLSTHISYFHWIFQYGVWWIGDLHIYLHLYPM